MAACSESDDTVEEYPDWQSKNETYFESQYQAHAAQTATSFILPGWSQPSSKTLSELEHTSCILVDVLGQGSGLSNPHYNDSVQVHYSGRLLPSTSYAAGYEFDRSYLTTFDADVDVPVTFLTSGVVEGFSTALQHMHRGDYWRIYIPYQLGYGESGSSSIPGYSTLIFEIRLVDFWFKTKGDRD